MSSSTANADFTVNVSIPAIPEPDPNTLYSLRIQNQRRVQGIPVTFKDLHGEDEVCFLMATGTRLIKIREVSSENVDSFLIGEILTAYVPNAWEYQHIGVNNLSPNHNYLIKEPIKVARWRQLEICYREHADEASSRFLSEGPLRV